MSMELVASFAFLEHDCYPMAWKQLFAALEGLLLISRLNALAVRLGLGI